MADKYDAAEPGKPRRSWWLRTLLAGIVVLAVSCGYVAHQSRFVAARNAWINSHIAYVEPWPTYYCAPKPANGPSALRRWFGDRAYFGIGASCEADKRDAETLFPEAHVYISPPMEIKELPPE